jgi:hypothetical protein
MSIQIPLRHNQGAIDVPISDLPEDAYDIISILKDETPPVTTWLQFAVTKTSFSSLVGILQPIQISTIHQHPRDRRFSRFI